MTHMAASRARQAPAASIAEPHCHVTPPFLRASYNQILREVNRKIHVGKVSPSVTLYSSFRHRKRHRIDSVRRAVTRHLRCCDCTTIGKRATQRETRSRVSTKRSLDASWGGTGCSRYTSGRNSHATDPAIASPVRTLSPPEVARPPLLSRSPSFVLRGGSSIAIRYQQNPATDPLQSAQRQGVLIVITKSPSHGPHQRR
jgi:hypothetical protein